MLRKLRISLQWATWILLIGSVFLIGQRAVRAAGSAAVGTPVPFLTNPYYGSTLNPMSLFDHDSPAARGYDGGISIVAYDGTTRNYDAAGNCGAGYSCYSGHAGYDYWGVLYNPVLASAAGTVTVVKWQNANHSYGCGLYITLLHTSVTPNRQTLYCHLSAVLVQVGNIVAQKQQIGTSGNTGDTGIPRTPHLHFEVRVPNVNGQSSWSSTDPNGWTSAANDPWKGRLDGAESVRLWVAKPVVAKPTAYASFIIDDGRPKPKFKKWCAADPAGGPACIYWSDSNVSGAYGGHMFFTYATNGTLSDYQAQWTPGTQISADGMYEVQVYIPAYFQTPRVADARYIVHSNAGNRTIVVDQNFYDQSKWVSLGTYFFSAGTGWVRVSDAAFLGNDVDTDDKVVIVDAVKFIRRSSYPANP